MLLSSKELIARILDVFLPPLCVFCKSAIQSQEFMNLCGNCWKQVKFITKPYCKICGFPLEYGDDDQVCIGCLRNTHHFDSARSAIIYGSVGGELILRFKHADQTNLSKMFSGWLMRVMPDIPEKNNTIIAPVPLHWSRLLFRKYNQAALLSNHLSLNLGIHCIPNLLIRIKRTKSQGRFGFKQRCLNVKNAFCVNDRYKDYLKDKTVILIDDVFTTGSTVDECSKTLKSSDAKAVHVITIARTDHPQKVS